MPVNIFSAKAVWLKNKLYMVESLEAKHRMYIYTPATDEWSTTNIPVHNSALVTYHSNLVLVGGRRKDTASATNKLFTMISLGQWRETIPPMSEERYHATAVEYKGNILVAGGCNESHLLNTVEFYNGLHWALAQCLPKGCSSTRINSTVFDGQWYLMGAELNESTVCYVPLDSLVASSQASEKPVHYVWKRLTDVRATSAIPAVFGNRLIILSQHGSSISAYSPHTQLWVIVGETPSFEVKSCVVFIPSLKELMIIGHKTASSLCSVYRAHLTGTVTVACTCIAYP